MVFERTHSRRFPILLLVSVVLVSIAFSGAVAAQSPVQTDTVDVDGSEITLVLADGANSAAVDSFDPEDVEVEFGDDADLQPGGAIWQNPASDTVSFTLTPADHQDVGDTITFEVFDGADTETVTLTVVDESDDEDASDDEPSDRDSVQLDGSEISFEVADGAAAAAVENFDPEDVELSDLGDGDAQPDGAIWNGPDGDTISFTLTPADHQDVGDTISFDVFDGADTETVTVEIVDDLSPVPDDFVGAPEQFRAIDTEGDGELGSIEIAMAITENAEEGSVDGVEISPIEFAQIIDWNSNQ